MNSLQLNSHSKIVIVGTSGSGKTTLAHALARKFNMPDIELDALYWKPQWTPTEPEAFQSRVQNATEGRGWIVHGNYSRVREMLWNKADVIIWLDYPRRLVWWRILRRSLQRAWTRDKICGENRESFRKTFFSKDSIILWSLRTYNRNRRLYGELMSDPHFGPKMLRVSSPREAARLLG